MKTVASPSSTALVLALAASGCVTPDEPPAPDFVVHVKPVLETNCLPCHNTGLLLGRLNLENREYVFSEKYGGPYVVPGDPDKSKLYRVLGLPAGSDLAMPPLKHRLSAYEKAMVREWIEAGAEWPEDASGRLVPPGATTWQTPDTDQLL